MHHERARRILGVIWICIGASACNGMPVTAKKMNDGDKYRVPRDDDVCKLKEDVAIGQEEEDGMVHIPADHPDIFYSGRVDCSNPAAPAFAYPGVSIRARFEGDAVDMLL
jgi:hypothetical protein